MIQLIECDGAGISDEECSTIGGAQYIADLDMVTNSANRPVISVCFEPTNECPGKCPYCLIENKENESSSKQLDHVLGHLYRDGIKRVGFGGGEPLLRPDVFIHGQELRIRGIGSLLRTSAMFPIDCLRARDSFDWIDISMDSVDPIVFRACRPGVPLEILKQNIVRLTSAGVRVRVSILITQRNISTLPSTVDWICETGVKELRIQRLVKRGKANRTWAKLKVETEEESRLISSIIDQARGHGSNARELLSVNSRTLCIVKGSGEVFDGSPDGSRRVSHVCNPLWNQNETATLAVAQHTNYLVQHDAHTY